MSSCDRSPPMLLIPTGKNGIWRPFNVMDDRLLGSQLKLGKRRFCGSSKGWLIAVEKDFTVTLTNPFRRYKGMRMKENSIIHLPPINPPNFNKHKWANVSNHYVFKASISADPILNSADCIVAVIYEGFGRLAFIRLGKERTWIYADGRHTLIEEVVFVEDKCYAVDNWSRLLSFDVTTRSNPNVNVVAKGIKRTGTNRPCVPHDYGVYNVETQSFSNSYSTQLKTQMRNAHKPAIWIVPAPQL
ncbi:putative F-box protein [Prunus yedoensis var. nudiflora]|uniref:Putative F-box protein n=1 Tax=Prunus yedoensis var. nudiflora TaxID=2094558 RepID=A0A314UX70_PRUYE|nr:putative F-box protein [Prunus yedoensis var. nudiflora]